MDHSILAVVRTFPDQADALHAAGISGDCDADGGNAGCGGEGASRIAYPHIYSKRHSARDGECGDGVAATILGRAIDPSLSWLALVRDYPPNFTVLLAAVLLFGASFFAWQRGVLVVLVLGLVAFYGSVYGRLFPTLDGLWLSRSAANMINPLRPACGQVIAIGYNEPSLVFLTDRSIKLLTQAEALEAVSSAPCSLVLSDAPLAFEAIGSLKGFNYARGKRSELTLYKVTR